MQEKIERNGKGEFVNTFRKSGSITPGNVLVTSDREYLVIAVNLYGSEVWLSVEYDARYLETGFGKKEKVIKLQGIDYVFIKLYL